MQDTTTLKLQALMAPAPFLPLDTFLRHSATSLPDSSKQTPNIWILILVPIVPHPHWYLSPIPPSYLTPSLCSYLHWFSTSKCLTIALRSSSWHKTKLFTYQEVRQSPFSPVLLSPIHWKAKGTWPNLVSHRYRSWNIHFLPFTLKQDRVLTYILLIPLKSLPPTSYILSTYQRPY